MAKVQFKRIEDSADIDDVAVVDGQFIVTKDGKIYIDYGNTRSEISGSGGGGGGSSAPIGTMTMFAGSTVPDGWLICDGSAISRTTYSQLFNKIGTTYGTGDGSTTFNIPNFKGRVPVGLDSTQTEFDTLGETGGEKTHTLTVGEMPSHTHEVKSCGTQGANTDNAKLSSATPDSSWNDSPQVESSIRNTGGGQAHNNLQPYAVTNVIIKAIDVQTSTTAVESLPIGSILEYDGVTAPEGYEEIDDNMTVATIGFNIGVVNAGANLYDQERTLTIPTGYTALGILGYRLMGGYYSWICFASMYLDGNKVKYALTNLNQTVATADLNCDLTVLLKKN